MVETQKEKVKLFVSKFLMRAIETLLYGFVASSLIIASGEFSATETSFSIFLNCNFSFLVENLHASTPTERCLQSLIANQISVCIYHRYIQALFQIQTVMIFIEPQFIRIGYLNSSYIIN